MCEVVYCYYFLDVGGGVRGYFQIFYIGGLVFGFGVVGFFFVYFQFRFREVFGRLFQCRGFVVVDGERFDFSEYWLVGIFGQIFRGYYLERVERVANQEGGFGYVIIKDFVIVRGFVGVVFIYGGCLVSRGYFGFVDFVRGLFVGLLIYEVFQEGETFEYFR